MTKYYSINVQLSNLQLDELKLGTRTLDKSPTKTNFKNIRMAGDTKNETNFPHKLLLTNRLVLSLCQAFENKYLPI